MTDDERTGAIAAALGHERRAAQMAERGSYDEAAVAMCDAAVAWNEAADVVNSMCAAKVALMWAPRFPTVNEHPLVQRVMTDSELRETHPPRDIAAVDDSPTPKPKKFQSGSK